MTDEPIPDEFGSWARLLPMPEEKQPAVEKAADESTSPAKAAEELPVIESTADETATLAVASDEMFADDEPLFAQAPSDEMVIAAGAGHEIVDDEKPSVAVVAAEKTEPQSAEPAAVEKTAERDVTDVMAPVEAVTEKVAELKTAEEKPAEHKPAVATPAETTPAETKPVAEKSVSHPAVDEKVKRPFRVKLRGSLLVLVRLPNKRTIQGSFHQLSTSGGVIHFEKPLDEKLEVELIFHLKTTTIRSKGQMLFPMWATQGWMQPFRFVGLAEDNRRVLDEGLKSFVGDAAKSTSAGA